VAELDKERLQKNSLRAAELFILPVVMAQYLVTELLVQQILVTGVTAVDIVQLVAAMVALVLS